MADTNANGNVNGKPRVLIMGGTGFIGRNLVKYLVDNALVSYIKVADKSLPALAYLNAEHKAAFERKEIVSVQQADLSKDPHVAKVFGEQPGYDYVFNLCGETRFGLSEEDYKVKGLDPAVKCSEAAEKAGVKRWVEVSSGQVYASDKHAHKEDSKLDPWTVQAKYRLKAEEAVRAHKTLPWVVLRPAIVYGDGDLTGLSPRITCAAVYKLLNKKMKFLWDKDLRLNVVHVKDVVRAMWLAATELKPGSIYNLEDGSDLNQGKLNDILGNIFKIETGFLGNMLSHLAKLDLAGTAETANEEHIPGWQELCKKHEIKNTPLSPYIDKELMKQDNLVLDGTRITKESAFRYQHQISEALVREQIQNFITEKLFPPVI